MNYALATHQSRSLSAYGGTENRRQKTEDRRQNVEFRNLFFYIFNSKFSILFDSTSFLHPVPSLPQGILWTTGGLQKPEYKLLNVHSLPQSTCTCVIAGASTKLLFKARHLTHLKRV